MPLPVSVTPISMSGPTRVMTTSTLPPSGVNLTALDRRFQRIWRSLAESPCTGASSGSIALWRPMRRASAAGLTASMAETMTAPSATRSTVRRIFPVMTRLRSRRSSMSWAWAHALRRMTSTPRRTLCLSSRLSRSTSAQPRMALRGVRSSCDSVARNSSLRCAVRSDSALAWRSLASS